MQENQKEQKNLYDFLRQAGLRPTLQRIGLSSLLFECSPRHICAENLYQEAQTKGLSVSLATVYNTLNQFKEAGLLREISLGGERTFFDTNLTPHFHIFYEKDGVLEDLPQDVLQVQTSEGFFKEKEVHTIDLVVRV